MLDTQSNLAQTYQALGYTKKSRSLKEKALSLQQDVYSGYLKLYGNEHRGTCLIAENYALTLMDLGRFKEAKRVMRQTIPAAQRVIGANHVVTLKIRWCYAEALYKDDCAKAIEYLAQRGDERGRSRPAQPLPLLEHRGVPLLKPNTKKAP